MMCINGIKQSMNRPIDSWCTWNSPRTEVCSSIHFPGRMKIVVKTASQSEWRSTAPALGKGVGQSSVVMDT